MVVCEGVGVRVEKGVGEVGWKVWGRGAGEPPLSPQPLHTCGNNSPYPDHGSPVVVSRRVYGGPYNADGRQFQLIKWGEEGKEE